LDVHRRAQAAVRILNAWLNGGNKSAEDAGDCSHAVRKNSVKVGIDFLLLGYPEKEVE
jgi:hypothetical protein